MGGYNSWLFSSSSDDSHCLSGICPVSVCEGTSCLEMRCNLAMCVEDYSRTVSFLGGEKCMCVHVHVYTCTCVYGIHVCVYIQGCKLNFLCYQPLGLSNLWSLLAQGESYWPCGDIDVYRRRLQIIILLFLIALSIKTPRVKYTLHTHALILHHGIRQQEDLASVYIGACLYM